MAFFLIVINQERPIQPAAGTAGLLLFRDETASSFSQFWQWRQSFQFAESFHPVQHHGAAHLTGGIGADFCRQRAAAAGKGQRCAVQRERRVFKRKVGIDGHSGFFPCEQQIFFRPDVNKVRAVLFCRV